MEHTSTSNGTPVEFAPFIFDRFKQVMTNIGVFFDISAYKKKLPDTRTNSKIRTLGVLFGWQYLLPNVFRHSS